MLKAVTMETNRISFRTGNKNDAIDVLIAFELFLNRQGDKEYIEHALQSYPSALVFKDDALIGFAYCGYMAPDLLELANISLHPDTRNSGVGTQLLKFLEREVSKRYHAILLTNSDLYAGKRNARNFYLKNGYRLIAGTGKTNLFWKDLRN